MMGEKGLQAVIFDLDGTLLDSMHVWEQVDQRFLRENRILPPAGISDRLKTMGIREAAAFFISEFALDMTPEQVIARIENLAAEEYRLRIPLKPGVLEVLDGLDARHIPYCIATATYDSLVEAALERLGIRHRFRFVLTCSQVGSTKAKPDIYLECARRLGHASREILVAEDALHAIETANSAEFFTFGVYEPTAAADWQRIREISGGWGMELTELLQYFI